MSPGVFKIEPEDKEHPSILCGYAHKNRLSESIILKEKAAEFLAT